MMAEKVDPPSGSPVLVRVVREEIPLSRSVIATCAHVLVVF